MTSSHLTGWCPVSESLKGKLKEEFDEFLEKLPNSLTWFGMGILACSLFEFTHPEETYLVFQFSGLFFLFFGSLWKIHSDRNKRGSVQEVPDE
jgi:hypothetical protein